jgi:hypothetical protein
LPHGSHKRSRPRYWPSMLWTAKPDRLKSGPTGSIRVLIGVSLRCTLPPKGFDSTVMRTTMWELQSVDSNYVFVFLIWRRSELAKRSRASTVKEVRKGVAERVEMSASATFTRGSSILPSRGECNPVPKCPTN